MASIVWFRDLGRDDAAIAGGKGANLGELMRGGFPVPEGFVVTAAAYLNAMDEAGVRTLLREAAGTPALRRARIHARLDTGEGAATGGAKHAA